MRNSLLALALLFSIVTTASADVAPGPFIVVGIGVIAVPIALTIALVLLGIWIARRWRRHNPYMDDSSDTFDETDSPDREP